MLIMSRQLILQLSGLADHHYCSCLRSRQTGVQISRKKKVTEPIFQVNDQHQGYMVSVGNKLKKSSYGINCRNMYGINCRWCKFHITESKKRKAIVMYVMQSGKEKVRQRPQFLGLSRGSNISYPVQAWTIFNLHDLKKI